MLVSKFKKFKTWGVGNIATLVFSFIAFSIVPLALAAFSDSIQGTVTGVFVCAASTFACVRYFQWTQEYGCQFVFYSPTWGCNIWCTDERARERWSFGVETAIVAAMTMVATRLGDNAHVHIEGLRIEIVDKPFFVPEMEGLQRGVYFPSSHVMKLSWPEESLWPPTIYHELLHAVIAHRYRLDGGVATHAKMQELAAAGVIPREWC